MRSARRGSGRPSGGAWIDADRNVPAEAAATRAGLVVLGECYDISSDLSATSHFAALEAATLLGFESKMASATRGQIRERILVAEDDLVSAELMQQLLELEGFEVAIATNAAGALREAHAFEPRTILLDLQLGIPGLDGSEVCRRLKASGTGARIVALTGNLEEDEQGVRDVGFDALVYRPVRADVLLDRLAVL